MHAAPDGFAIADHPPATPASVCADAVHDVEIGFCITRLRRLVAAGFALTLLSAAVAFDWPHFALHDPSIGYLGVALFGPVTAWLIWQLPVERGPVVVITPYGIRDLRIGNEFLLWDSIVDVSAEECRGHKVIVLTPTPELRQQLSCIRAAKRGAETERIVIRAEGLAIDFDTLLRLCRNCHAANAASAMRQEDEHGVGVVALQAS